MREVLKILYEWREGTTKRRMLSLVLFISHKAVKIPFFCVFLLIWPSVPGSGNRKCIPCIYHGLQLPAFGAGGFWGVSHNRAMRMSQHCSSRPLKEVHPCRNCGTMRSVSWDPYGAVPPLLPPSCRKTDSRRAIAGVQIRRKEICLFHEVLLIVLQDWPQVQTLPDPVPVAFLSAVPIDRLLTVSSQAGIVLPFLSKLIFSLPFSLFLL